ncbi:DUF2752 domain-containing protein [Brachyspira alvinipulli]|uniref:DUF2752 domain-containing protein n=1 Tax=Brachyspira alvinipulli TaxID=84379 RepID=UPI0004808A9C|nr:DUF2752 domain-containing protein [Brachyspira alvinipulli]
MFKIIKIILIALLVLFINYDNKNHKAVYNIPIDDLCIIRNNTGFPCPSCGMTRAHIEVLKLNFEKAFYYHPLFVLPSIIFLVVMLRNKSKIANYIYNNNFITITVLIIFIAVYIIRFIMLFPHTEPFTYNYDSNLYLFIRIMQNIK